MNMLGDLMQWFAGGPDGYMPLDHCMKGDSFWIALTILLDLAVALGYVLIARHWWENEKLLPESQAKLALGNMKRIFLFCGAAATSSSRSSCSGRPGGSTTCSWSPWSSSPGDMP